MMGVFEVDGDFLTEVDLESHWSTVPKPRQRQSTATTGLSI